VCVSCFSHVRLFATLWTVAHQAPLSVGFSRQEYWNGLLCPLPRDLPDPGIEPASLMSPALADRFFTTSTTCVHPKRYPSFFHCPNLHPNQFNPKGNQCWIFTGKSVAEAEAPVLWPPDVKSWNSMEKTLWCWERLKAKGEGGSRGWDGLIASLNLPAMQEI